MRAPRPSRTPAVLALALAFAGAGAGCSAGRAEAPRPTAPAPAADAPVAPAPTGAADADLEALFWARLDSARTRFTDADVHFVAGMIAHHAQAVHMARLADTRAGSPSVRTLALRILSGQQDEIALMQQWLGERALPVPHVQVTDTGVTVHGADHALHAHGPGMLTPEQMHALEQAEGAAFDRLFLTSMIEHHRGALSMVHELFATDGAGQDPALFRFASDVQVDQATEIARMERMLAELPPGGGVR